MSVLQNVLVAAQFGSRRERADHPVAAARAALERVGLADRAGDQPGELSIADARRLELARALALRPRVLLLDEVLAGLRPGELAPALALIDSLRADGLALLMVEHVVQAISAIADEVLVLHHGEVLTHGSAAEVLADDRVVAAYLGARYAARRREEAG
jgi:branched-chain amino acid transport system ATP-binding protein